MNALEVMQAGPVIPVIVIERLADAVPLARALVAGGVRVLELTLRTRVALEAIERVAAEVEGAIVGAGTLTRPEDVEAVLRAGAVFGVSPGLTRELAAAARAGGEVGTAGSSDPSGPAAKTKRSCSGAGFDARTGGSGSAA